MDEKRLDEILYENNFGKIAGNKLLINKNEGMYRFSNINFMELHEKPISFNMRLVIIGMAIAGYFFQNHMIAFLLFSAFITVLIYVLCKKRKQYFIKVLFSNPATVYLPLSRKELKDAKAFINAFNRYKSQYFYFD